MDWVPIIFGIFKLTVLIVAAYFAIKWHYEKGKEEKAKKAQQAQQAQQQQTPQP